MNWISLYLPVILILVAVWLIRLVVNYFERPSDNALIRFPYQKKNYLLSVAEKLFYTTLRQAVNDEFYIFPQINLDKIIFVEKGTGKYLSYYRKMNQYSVDFLLCDKNSISPVLAIELDDSSHDTEKRQNRDQFVNQALQAAGIKVLRIPCKSGYDVAELINQVKAKMT